MDEEVIFEENFVRMLYIQNLKLLKVVWSGVVSAEQYEQALLFALDYQKKTEKLIENYLSDIRRQGVVSPQSRKWFEQVALPRAMNQGLKKGAVVFEGSVFKKYYLNLIMQATSIYRFPFRFFNSMEDAIKWLESTNNQ